jgi:hypothetical protein
LQTGVPDGQSVSTRQSTHVLSVAQNFPVCAAQSVFARHSTHEEVVVLQTGAEPPHCVGAVQPVMHVNVCGLQIGLAAPQSELSRQATHFPVAA